MATADVVSPDLRSRVRAARAEGTRCLQVGISRVGAAEPSEAGDGVQRQLTLTQTTQEVPGAAVDEEFVRCVKETSDENGPCLFLFRTDQRENIDGCRWLLVAWLPIRAPEAERAIYIRSRGLLADLVPQPYFLREFFASTKRELSWKAVRETGAVSAGGIAIKEPVAPQAKIRRTPFTEDAQDGLVALSISLLGKLNSFAKRDDKCLKLFFAHPVLKPGEVAKPPTAGQPAALEARTCEARSLTSLVESGVIDFRSCCYLAMHRDDNLVFVLWCPSPSGPSLKDPKDSSSRDGQSHKIVAEDARAFARVAEDARYALLYKAVLNAVTRIFPKPRPHVVQIHARDTDGLDAHTQRVTAAAKAGRDQPSAHERWPTPGTEAHWPEFWPSTATMSIAPVSLALPERPVPFWRGGHRGATLSTATMSRTRVYRVATTYYKDGLGGF